MKRSREPENESPEVTRPIPSAATTAGGNHGSPGPNSKSDGETLPPAAKITELDLSDNESICGLEIRCSLPPHREPLVFSSYGEYEAHYRDQHTNRCVDCRKNFPSAHLLGLHIEEMHDSFAQLRRERGEQTYSCFVEGCDKKCSTPQKRKMHLVDKHMYPKNFFFAVTREGVDGRRSLLSEGRGRHRRPSISVGTRQADRSEGQGRRGTTAGTSVRSTDGHAAADSDQKSPEKQPDQEMEDLSSAMSALQFVPPSVRFGRGKKAGFAKQ